MNLLHMLDRKSKSISLVLPVGLILALCIPLFGQSESLAEKSRRAQDLLSAGQPEKAIPIYQEMVRALPGNPGLTTNLGIALSIAGRDQDAIKEFDAALKLKPHYPNALLFLAMAYLNLDQPQKPVE